MMKSVLPPLDPSDPRDRILDSAINEFAAHGFHGATTRTIAAGARVNISMINYYYGSKQGLLKAATERYFRQISALIHDVFGRPEPPDRQLSRLIREIISFFRAHRNLVAVVINTWSLEIPEAASTKVEFLKRISTFFEQAIIPRMPGLSQIPNPATIVGPAVIGSIAIHFMFQPVIEEVLGHPCDDLFYDHMSNLLSTVFTHGLIDAYSAGESCSGEAVS